MGGSGAPGETLGQSCAQVTHLPVSGQLAVLVSGVHGGSAQMGTVYHQAGGQQQDLPVLESGLLFL